MRVGSRMVRPFSLPLLMVAWLTAHPAEAQPSAFDKAREYFRAGAEAYTVGEFAAAIQAFEQAYALVPRPAVLFSIAQAERRQYLVDNKLEHVSHAIEMYKKYIELEPHGSRKGDAVAAIIELTRLLPPEAPSVPEEAIPLLGEVEPVSTRLMVSSPADGAKITLDNDPPVSSPLIREVTPGEHQVRVVAPGYVEATRQLVSISGALVTLDVPLAERPARLIVQARDGAQLTIDGRVQGECPFSQPLELPAGTHVITLTKSGFVGSTREEVLVRGETTTLRVAMPQSWQRTTSIFMFGASVSALMAGGIFAILSNGQEQAAESFLGARGRVSLNEDDLAQYESSKRDRNRLRLAAVGTAGGGVVLGVTGLMLYVLDPARVVISPVERDRDAGADKASRAASVPLPVLAPGYAGLDFRREF